LLADNFFEAFLGLIGKKLATVMACPFEDFGWDSEEI
jgi:hypothetical protein